VWKLANHNKPAKSDLKTLFARVKQMEGIDDGKYWSKRPSWKQPKYDREKKISQSYAKAEKHFVFGFAQ
jgi:hypothetical protein